MDFTYYYIEGWDPDEFQTKDDGTPKPAILMTQGEIDWGDTDQNLAVYLNGDWEIRFYTYFDTPSQLFRKIKILKVTISWFYT